MVFVTGGQILLTTSLCVLMAVLLPFYILCAPCVVCIHMVLIYCNSMKLLHIENVWVLVTGVLTPMLR